MKVPQPFAIFVVENDTLIVLVLWPQPLSQKKAWVDKSKFTNHQGPKKI